jgi:hypothetical protein
LCRGKIDLIFSFNKSEETIDPPPPNNRGNAGAILQTNDSVEKELPSQKGDKGCDMNQRNVVCCLCRIIDE